MSAKKHYFITGTSQGVGKTYVINALLSSCCDNGVRAAGFKPICCGDRTEARHMREAMQQPTLSLDILNPVYLRSFADPFMAAELEHKTVDTTLITAAFEQLTQDYDVLLVEDCFHWMTPIATNLTMADIAASFGLPVIIVADNKRGAAGEVAMLQESVIRHGLTCAGVILNHPGDEWDTAAVTNADLIERTTGLPILASLIRDDIVDTDVLDSVVTVE